MREKATCQQNSSSAKEKVQSTTVNKVQKWTQGRNK